MEADWKEKAQIVRLRDVAFLVILITKFKRGKVVRYQRKKCEVFCCNIWAFQMSHKSYSKLIFWKIEGREHEAAERWSGFSQVIPLEVVSFYCVYNFVWVTLLFGYLNIYVFVAVKKGIVIIFIYMIRFCRKWRQRNSYKVMVSVVGWHQTLITE
jgi:hypothetical protein